MIKKCILLTCFAAVLLPTQVARAEGEYEFYYGHIGSELGAGYAQEYYNLVRGNYRYGPKLAAYCVYAFSNGFTTGYWHGSVNRQYVDSGAYASYAQQLRASAAAAYNQQLALVRSWVGVGLSPGERQEMEIALYGGWDAGWNRGYREKGSVVPQPGELDFRSKWSPGKSIAPIPSDDDPFGELRHAR